MTIDEIKQELDKLDVDYSGVTKKADLQALLDESQDAKKLDTAIVDQVKALAVQPEEQTQEKQKDSDEEFYKTVEYSKLNYFQKLKYDAKYADEYTDVEGGTKLRITPRYTGEGRTEKIADGTNRRFLSGKEYLVSDEDKAVLLDLMVTVKTEATKTYCCGRAEWESVPLFEVV